METEKEKGLTFRERVTGMIQMAPMIALACAGVFLVPGRLLADASTNRTVRVGYYTLPGYCERGAGGRWHGVNVELMSCLAASNGWAVARVPIKWGRADVELASGAVDIVPGVPLDVARAATNWYSSVPTGLLHPYLFARADNPVDAADRSAWAKWRVGSVNRELALELMRQVVSGEDLRFRVKDYGSTEEMRIAFDTWACSGVISPAVPALRGAKVIVDFGFRPLHVAVARGRKDLYLQVERVLKGLVTDDPGYFSRLQAERFTRLGAGELPPPPRAATAGEKSAPVAEREQVLFARPEHALILSVAVIMALAAFLLFMISSRRHVQNALGRSAQSLLEADAANRESRRIVEMGDHLRKAMEVMLREGDPEHTMPTLCAILGDMTGVDGVTVRTGEGAEAVVRWFWRRASVAEGTMGNLAFDLSLTVNGKTWGWICGQAVQPVKFDAAGEKYLSMFVQAVENFLRMAEASQELAEQHEELQRNVRRLGEVADQQQKLRGMLEALAGDDDPMANIRQVMAEAARLFGSDCCVIVRRVPGGGLDRPYWWVAPGLEAGFPKRTVPHELVVTALLEHDPVLVYPRKTRIGELPDIDALIDKYHAYALVAAALHVRGTYWGHVLFVSNNKAVESTDVRDLLLEVVRVLEISLRRRMLMDEIVFKQRGLEQALSEAERASRAKTRFLASISHEIRTPLNAVIGFTEELEGHASEGGQVNKCPAHDRVVACAGRIKNSAKVLLELLNDVIDLSRIEFGVHELRNGRCDIGRMMNELADIFEGGVREKGLEMKVTVAPDFPCVRLSEQSVRQVLLNLIGNAVKFTAKGEVQVAAAWNRSAHGLIDVRLLVRDTGCGIEPERIGSVFSPFERDIAVNGDVFQGVGFGLAIVKRLVEAAGGRIKLESRPGVGTVVAVDIDGLEEVGGAAAATGGAVRAEDFSAVKVLAVDDVPLNLTIMGVHLRKAGVTAVRTARNGKDALAMVRQDPPDVLITDVWMPEMNGPELAHALRDDKSLPQVWLVAATADVAVENSFDIDCFDQVISKPVTGEKIRGVLREWLEKRKGRG